MDYKNGKVYKVQFDDGHFYYGSSAGELRARLHGHRHCINRNGKSACSRYMQEVGTDACRIVLVEDYPCENKDQLRRKEDEYIQLHRENPLCLNIMRAFLTPEERKEGDRVYYKTHWEERKAYREDRKEEGKSYDKAYKEEHKEEIKARGKAYREAHKEKRDAYQKAYRERKKAEKLLAGS